MLRGEAGTLARKLAQAFGVNAFGASRIEADRAEQAALLHQTRKGAVTGRAGRLTRPGQIAHRGAFLGRQQSIQRLGLRGKQASGQLIGDLALGKRRCRCDQTLDDGSARSDDLSSPQLVHQRRGDRHGVRIPERHWHQPRPSNSRLCCGAKHAEAECRPQRAQLLATRLVRARRNWRVHREQRRSWPATKASAASGIDLARAQQAPRIAESAELQRETELVRIAAAALYGREIGGTQGPVPDQFRFGDR